MWPGEVAGPVIGVTLARPFLAACLTAAGAGGSLARRLEAMPERSETHAFGPFRLDAGRLVLWRDDEVVSLPPKATALLAALVRAGGDVVSKEELLACVWPDVTVEESNLTVTMSALRRCLGRRSDGRPYIETLSRRGYRFCASPLETATPTLGVLPFRNLSRGEDRDGLGIAMADALITRLAGTGRVAVRPTSTIVRYASRGGTPRQAARELRVDAVLEGHFQRQRDRLRVTAQLVPTDRKTPSWSARFEGPFADLFALQDSLADELAAALHLQLDGRERRALKLQPTRNLEAYQAFARGVHLWFRLTSPSLRQAISCFDEALGHDPAYAFAHVGKASAYMALALTGSLAPREAWPRAEEAVRRALGAGSPPAIAHVVDAYVKVLAGWDWASSDAAMRRALAIDKRSANAHQWNALLRLCEGRLREADESAVRALAEDPVSVVAHAARGLRWTLAGDDRRALEHYGRVVELEPNHVLGHWGRGVSLVRLGRHGAGLSALRRACRLSRGNPALCSFLAWGLGATGRTKQARAMLARLQSSAAAYVSPYQRASIHVALGETDEALRRLAEAARERDPWILLLKVDPKLAPLRGLPAFRMLEMQVFASAAGGDLEGVPSEKLRRPFKTPIAGRG
jgi:DNA-binding winged helix-turn-helix (wHTH) protein/tetratricopeptide (TPR) repeat protein